MIIADGFVFSQITPETVAHCILEDGNKLYWKICGMLEYWMIGRLDYWKTGELLEFWISGSLYYWKTGEILEHWITIKDVLLVAFVQHLEVSITPVLKITSRAFHCSQIFFLTDHKLRILYIPRFIADSGDPFALPIRKL